LRQPPVRQRSAGDVSHGPRIGAAVRRSPIGSGGAVTETSSALPPPKAAAAPRSEESAWAAPVPSTPA
jgi:hypothetical protein